METIEIKDFEMAEKATSIYAEKEIGKDEVLNIIEYEPLKYHNTMVELITCGASIDSRFELYVGDTKIAEYRNSYAAPYQTIPLKLLLNDVDRLIVKGSHFSDTTNTLCVSLNLLEL